MTRLTMADLEIERPGEPLEIVMGDGSVFTLQDPKALSLSTVLGLEEMPPLDQVRALIADDKFHEFAARPDVDGYFFEALVKRYLDHYGLGKLGEGVASLPRFKGTARRSKRTSRSGA